MRTKNVESLRFNYPRFYSDLNKYCKANKINLKELSSKKYYRNGSYLDKYLAHGTVPMDILADLASMIGVKLKDYEIQPQKIEKPVIQKKPDELADDRWKIEVKVDEEYGVAMVKIIKDGEKICTGQSYIYGTDYVGIVQSISYATHMCYKMVQQGAIKETVDGKAKKEDLSNLIKGEERIIFKDWIKKFEKDNSPYGRLARYVSSEYNTFPTKGEKEMKYYLQMHKGEAHLPTFKTTFSLYLSWMRASEV